MEEIQYFKLINGVGSIGKQKMPFCITKKKCESYLDIFYPDLKVDDHLLEKCVLIFKQLLNYADGFDHNESHVSIWIEFQAWDKYPISPLKIFKTIFQNKIAIVLDDPNHGVNEIALDQLLLSNSSLNKYWNESYNYNDLHNVLLEVSIKIKHKLPKEIIETICCLAFKRLYYIR